MTTYKELRLRIAHVSGRSYRVHASGPAGDADSRFRLPFSDLELENVMLRMAGRGRGGNRGGADSPEMELAKSFGAKLFEALFQDEVRDLYHSSLSDARNGEQGLRVTVSLTDAPKLRQVPWEYLYEKPSFLSISTWTPVVRYLDLPKPRRPLAITLPLRILGLVSAPTDRQQLDAAKEQSNLATALAPLASLVTIDWLEEASLSALTRQLRLKEYHVFHYIGHGEYDRQLDDGLLLFEDHNHLARRVSGDQLGMILRDKVSLRLAVLNACEGAQSSPKDPFSGVGSRLIEHEIPAVVAMQFEITDRAAIIFAKEFYSALAEGLPVDSSIAEARKAIYADHNDIEWGTPVLFMRVADGRLFDVQPPEPELKRQAERAAEVERDAQAKRAAEAERADEPQRAAEAQRAETQLAPGVARQTGGAVSRHTDVQRVAERPAKAEQQVRPAEQGGAGRQPPVERNADRKARGDGPPLRQADAQSSAEALPHGGREPGTTKRENASFILQSTMVVIGALFVASIPVAILTPFLTGANIVDRGMIGLLLLLVWAALSAWGIRQLPWYRRREVAKVAPSDARDRRD